MLTYDSKLVVGYTTQDHLLVDLDNCSLSRAKYTCRMLQTEWPFLGDILVVRSSPQHYHLICDDFVEWEKLVHIIEILADLCIVQRAYATVRTFRRDLTLRVSPKHGIDRYRPSPEPCFLCRIEHICNGHQGINKYLDLLQIFNKDVVLFRKYVSNIR